MQHPEQELLAKLSDAELDALAAELDRVKPWRGIDYALLYFLRRWMVTIWMFIALFCWDFTSAGNIILFALIFTYEWIFGRYSWDLNVTTHSILSIFKEREVSVSWNRYALLIICTLVTISYIAIYILKETRFISLELSEALAFVLLFVGLILVSRRTVLYFLAGFKKHNFPMTDFLMGNDTCWWKSLIINIGLACFYSASLLFGAMMLWVYHWFASSIFEEAIDLKGVIRLSVSFIVLLPSVLVIRLFWANKSRKILAYIKTRRA